MKKPKEHSFWITPVRKGRIQVMDLTRHVGEIIDSPIVKEYQFYGTLTEFRLFLKEKEKEAKQNLSPLSGGVGNRAEGK